MRQHDIFCLPVWFRYLLKPHGCLHQGDGRSRARRTHTCFSKPLVQDERDLSPRAVWQKPPVATSVSEEAAGCAAGGAAPGVTPRGCVGPDRSLLCFRLGCLSSRETVRCPVPASRRVWGREEG